MSFPLACSYNDGIFTLPFFQRLGLKASFTTRRFDAAFEAKNADRRRALAALGVPVRRLIAPNQAHGDRVVVVDERFCGRGALSRAGALPATDALATNVKNIALSVLAADCLPVLIFDPKKRAVAVVHAGWKGLAKKIISKTVGKMAEAFGSETADLFAAFGPAIRGCCYEVGEDFLKHVPHGPTRRNGKFYFDIPAEAETQLQECGVRPSRIFDSRVCTSCMNAHFFSFRREGGAAGRIFFLAEIL